MLKKLDNTVLPIVLSALEKDIPNCLYMYIDLRTYGIDGERINAWYLGTLEKIELIVMEYYESVQIYSCENVFDPEKLADWLMSRGYTRISSSKTVVEMIYPFMENDYSSEYGTILALSEYKLFQQSSLVKTASLEVIPQIVELIMNTEELSGGYSHDELCKQFTDRIKTKTGCTYYIEDDGVIVATASITAQVENIAVASMTAVRTNSRDKLWGVYIDSFLLNHYKKKDIRLYAMFTDEKRMRMFLKMHNKAVAEYGKLIRK